MCHVLVSQEARHACGLLRVVLGILHCLGKLLLFDETYASRHRRKSHKHIAEELSVDVVGMEYDALAWCCRQQDDGTCHLVDGRELDTLVAHGVRTAAEHVIDLDASHERVGGEVGLELAVGTACGKVAHTHDLGIESLLGDRIEDEAFGHELRIDVLVAKILTHVEALLGEGGV